MPFSPLFVLFFFFLFLSSFQIKLTFDLFLLKTLEAIQFAFARGSTLSATAASRAVAKFVKKKKRRKLTINVVNKSLAFKIKSGNDERISELLDVILETLRQTAEANKHGEEFLYRLLTALGTLIYGSAEQQQIALIHARESQPSILETLSRLSSVDGLSQGLRECLDLLQHEIAAQ